MSDMAWGDYGRERFEAANDEEPYLTRRIGGSFYDENDIPDEEDL